MAHDELIGYIPRATLTARDMLHHGFTPDATSRFWPVLTGELEFAPRGPLEEDPSNKQLIPYVVITRGEEIYTMRRKERSREARLHDRGSIGVGGHLGKEDGHEGLDLLLAGMWRELCEEVAIDPLPPLERVRYRGLINDDTNDVGRVHLGVIFHLALDDAARVAILEEEKLEGGWSTLSNLREAEDALETWSALLLGALEGWLKTP